MMLMMPGAGAGGGVQRQVKKEYRPSPSSSALARKSLISLCYLSRRCPLWLKAALDAQGFAHSLGKQDRQMVLCWHIGI